MPTLFRNVRSQGQSRKHVLALSFSGFDPGCVKTCTSQECAELFSLSSSLSGGRKHFWFSNLRNRDGISTRRLNVGVFTRPRPTPEVAPLTNGRCHVANYWGRKTHISRRMRNGSVE